MTAQMVFPLAHPPSRSARGKHLATAARVSPAAVRVPDPRHTPLRVIFPWGHPQIFVHEGARQSLERRIAVAHGRPALLSVTDNRRRMITSCHRGGVLRARVHHMFLDAPPSVQEALARFLVDGDRAASLVVGRYIDDNGLRIRATRPVLAPVLTQGNTHDLLALFRAVNERYFAGSVDALITWGRRSPAGDERRTIKLGSYSASERLIRIHPVLDRPWVPRYFLSYVVYHEMLHHVIPAVRVGNRRILHPPVFQQRERLFRDFERAMTWEATHIGRLLRA